MRLRFCVEFGEAIYHEGNFLTVPSENFETLFAQAISLPSAELEAFLDVVGKQSPDTRKKLELFLEADRQNQTSRFLDWPALNEKTGAIVKMEMRTPATTP
ncbi:MAG: hypothetical protein R3C03_14480 [Pirellulaceae bacterium]